MAKTDAKPKIGSETLGAMARQGLRELRAAMYPDSNVAQQPEMGVYGTKTPGEVASDRADNAEARDLEDEKSRSALESRMPDEARGVHGPDIQPIEPE